MARVKSCLRRDWRDEMCASTNRIGRPDARAFRTFLSDPNAGAATHARYYARVKRNHRGKRRNLQRWGTTLLEGVLHDDIERVDDALAMPLATRDAVVEGGSNGAPLCFAGEALVTKARVKAQQRILQDGARDMAEAVGRFYSDNEWRVIDQHLVDKGSYLQGATFDTVEVGDTALHVAVRNGSFQVARRLLDRDYDPLVANRKGETIAKLIKDQFDATLAATTWGRSDVKQARARRQAALDALKGLADLARSKLDAYDTHTIQPLAYREWRSAIEQAGELSPEERATLARRDALHADRQLLATIIETAANQQLRVTRPSALTARALFCHKPAPPLLTIGDDRYDLDDDAAEHKEGSLSSVSSGFFDDVDLDQWLADLDHAALLVQSLWRSYSVRATIVEAVRAASATRLQARCRGFIEGGRRRLR